MCHFPEGSVLTPPDELSKNFKLRWQQLHCSQQSKAPCTLYACRQRQVYLVIVSGQYTIDPLQYQSLQTRLSGATFY